MEGENPTVFIIDDDVQILEYLTKLFQSVGLDVRTSVSANEFLKSDIPETPRCLILDVRMPGLSGLELHDQLLDNGIDIPVIFLTGFGNIPMSVKAMKGGAVDFIEKPFEDQVLLDAVHKALERSRRARRKKDELDGIKKRLDSLTEREYEVFELVVAGLLNKQIAFKLGISEKTVKVHRARVMKKMAATSLADLVKMSHRLAVDSSNV